MPAARENGKFLILKISLKKWFILFFLIHCTAALGGAMDNDNKGNEAVSNDSAFSLGIGRTNDTVTPEDGEPISTATIYFLTKDQIKELTKKAKEGDAQSSFSLYMFYGFSEYNEEKMLYWLTLSAKQGNLEAQDHLSVYYLMESDYDQAEFWTQESLKNGSPYAIERLKEIKEKRNKMLQR